MERPLLKKISVKRLNTIKCKATPKYYGDVRMMVCRIIGGMDEPTHRVEDVFNVEGNISVIASSTPDTIYIKTTPFIGMAADVEVIPRSGYPPGKTIRVKTGV